MDLLWQVIPTHQAHILCFLYKDDTKKLHTADSHFLFLTIRKYQLLWLLDCHKFFVLTFAEHFKGESLKIFPTFKPVCGAKKNCELLFLETGACFILYYAFYIKIKCKTNADVSI